MKRSFFGYNTKEVDKKISTLNEHNELLNKRIERQDEDIKELRARYAGFSTVETKLNTAVDAMNRNVANIDDSIDAVVASSNSQDAFSSASSQCPSLLEASLDAQTAAERERAAIEEAAKAVGWSRERSSKLQENLLDIAAISEAVCHLLEPDTQDDRTIDNALLLPFMRELKSKTLEAAALNIPFGIDQAAEHLSAAEIGQTMQAAAKVSERAARLQEAMNSTSAKLEEDTLALEGAKEEVADLQHSLSSVATVAAYVGKISNLGLADIERSKVTSLLGENSEESVHVDISAPSDLIDNTRPPVIPGMEGDESTPAADAEGEQQAVSEAVAEGEQQAASDVVADNGDDQPEPSPEPDTEPDTGTDTESDTER